MRVNDDITKTVLFFGYEDTSPGKGGIDCGGTGFLLNYDGVGHIVTAKHLAQELGSDPFVYRLNKKDGTSENFHPDGFRWYEHPDPTVDVAVAPFTLGASSPYDAKYIDEKMLVGEGLISHETIKTVGLADLTYTVGLFRLMAGKDRNLPIVHSGSIAMMPRQELIPVKNWRPPGETIFTEGYLIESQGLQGLSGAPVFVRPTASFSWLPSGFTPSTVSPPIPMTQALAPRQDMRLLGLWQGAWDAPPGDVLAAHTGTDVRVSVGLGVVVPAQKIIEALQHEELIALRTKVKAGREERDRSATVRPSSS